MVASGAGVPYTVRRLTRQPLASIRVLSIGWGWGHKRVVALDVPVDACAAGGGGGDGESGLAAAACCRSCPRLRLHLCQSAAVALLVDAPTPPLVVLC